MEGGGSVSCPRDPLAHGRDLPTAALLLHSFLVISNMGCVHWQYYYSPLGGIKVLCCYSTCQLPTLRNFSPLLHETKSQPWLHGSEQWDFVGRSCVVSGYKNKSEEHFYFSQTVLVWRKHYWEAFRNQTHNACLVTCFKNAIKRGGMICCMCSSSLCDFKISQ